MAAPKSQVKPAAEFSTSTELPADNLPQARKQVIS
jgi:hypothetical protein